MRNSPRKLARAELRARVRFNLSQDSAQRYARVRSGWCGYRSRRTPVRILRSLISAAVASGATAALPGADTAEELPVLRLDGLGLTEATPTAIPLIATTTPVRM